MSEGGMSVAAVGEGPFFERDGGRLVPTDKARGPWKAGTLHGRAIVGVLAAELERRHGDADYMPVRLTVDMHRAPGMVPFEIKTTVVRDGHRIRVIDAELISEGQNAGRATCQFLRRTENPTGQFWHGETSSWPAPETIPDEGPTHNSMHGLWELRWVTGEIGQVGQRRVWMRENRLMIAGDELSPFMRVAAGVDYVSPLGNVGDRSGFGYINSDVTLYLHREPVGEWIGYETMAHEASDGIGLAHCNIYDIEGRIGWASACALAQGFAATGKPRAETAS